MAVENNMDDELDQVSAEAMQIIMSAGDARVSLQRRLKGNRRGAMESARELIKKRKGQIAEAHHVQTDAIQGLDRWRDTGVQSAVCPCAGHADDRVQ